MGYKDLHDKPFDASTLAKLEIFEDYAEAWLPTFVMSKREVICIFDFFAGTGYDKNGVPGSPIILLDVIGRYAKQIQSKNVKIHIYYNEYKPAKYILLREAVESFLNDNKEVSDIVKYEIYNKDFDVIFTELYHKIEEYPSLVFLDQNGIKFLSDKYLLALEKTNTTDFLYFISASYFWRFGDKEEFKRHLDIDMDAAKKKPYQFIHRSLLEQLYKKLPLGSKLTLYPFSLKKGTNIHGIIFGAKHPRAVEKFLTVAWKRNKINGDANFDIDQDVLKGQLDMFEEKKKTKLEVFNEALEEKIRSNIVTNNAEIYLFALQRGHTPTQASLHIRRLRTQKKVSFIGISPKIRYSATVKRSELVEIKWQANGAK